MVRAKDNLADSAKEGIGGQHDSMAGTTILEAAPREVTGKKVKGLRKQGLIPAHLYGRETDSLALQAASSEIAHLIKTAGRNAIIDLKIDGEGEARPVVLRGVQQHPITDELLHVDFFQISLTETLQADVPVHIVGEAPAVTVYGGVLLQNLDTISIEALPTNIPPQIDVDISILQELDTAIFIRDLTLPPDVTVLDVPDQLVVKVSPPKLQLEVEAEEAEIAEGEAAAEAAEGEEAAEAPEAKEDGESED